MKIKGKVNRDIARKIYRTFEYEDYFVILDRDGGVGVEHEGKGYIADSVDELYEYFDRMLIDYLVREAMDVPICPICGKPIQDPYGTRCPDCEGKEVKRDPIRQDPGWVNLASEVCIRAIKEYDLALDRYADNPFDLYYRDQMLKLEMWIRGDEWTIYTMGKVDADQAIKARMRAAEKRWKNRQKEKARKRMEKEFASMVEEIKYLNERLKEYEDSESEGQSKPE